MARTIISKGQPAVRLALKAINATLEKPLSDGLKIEADLWGECCTTEDFKEGTKAFLEKRKPVFKGK
jgi:enoyl-CoA hydratase